VDDTLGLASRTRGVEDEEGSSEFICSGRVGGDLVGLLVPPEVTAGGHGDLVAGAAEDENLLDERALLEGGVDNGLGGDRLATTATLVRGEEDLGLAVVDTVAERLGGEAGKDGRVDGTDTGTGEEGSGRLPGHGEVDGDGVTLLDTPRAEDIGDAVGLVEELLVRDLAGISGLVGLVDDGRLLGVLVVVTVETVVRGVKDTLGAGGEMSARVHLAKWGKGWYWIVGAMLPGWYAAGTPKWGRIWETAYPVRIPRDRQWRRLRRFGPKQGRHTCPRSQTRPDQAKPACSDAHANMSGGPGGACTDRGPGARWR
jgi:hypothetical protein